MAEGNSTIELGKNDAALILREGGKVEMLLPNKEWLSDSETVMAMACMAMGDSERSVALRRQLLRVYDGIIEKMPPRETDQRRH